MTEKKTTLYYLRNKRLNHSQVPNWKSKWLIEKYPTNNIKGLNNLITAGANLVREKIGAARRRQIESQNLDGNLD